jgi:hypothetical protein
MCRDSDPFGGIPMKRVTTLLLLALAFLSPALAQIVKNEKPYIEPELTLIDVVRNVNSQLQPGERTIKQCCGGLKLVAIVEKGKGNNAGRNVIAKWKVYDQTGKELHGELVEPQIHENSTIETVVVLREFGYGFIVARRQAQ